jgi:hypothetical protein
MAGYASLPKVPHRNNLLQVLRLAPELLDLIGRRGPGGVAGEPALRARTPSSKRTSTPG